MNRHPYLRAYMAGITFPTGALIIAMTIFAIARYVYHVPLPIERVIVFPMAVVPNAWGLWNILYTSQLARRGVNIGIFGATLPVVLIPLAMLVAPLIGFGPGSWLALWLIYALPIAFAVYYLLWKHVVRALNQVVGL
jgi:hypothetical protein